MKNRSGPLEVEKNYLRKNTPMQTVFYYAVQW